VDDVRLEVVLEIEDVVRESHPARHGAAVVDGLERAAAAARRRTLRVAPELHGDADDRVSGALQERRGNARVDAAAHRDEHGRLAGGSEVVHGKSQDANDGEPARSFFTTSGTTSSTRSMSAEVVERPRLNRTADWAMFAGTPMPRRTCDAWDDPALHAEPALQAKPFMSSDRIRCSPSAPTNERWDVLQTRGAPVPCRTTCGTDARSPSSIRSRSAAIAAGFSASSACASCAAIPSPTIAGTFSVPARLPRSCSPPK